MSVIGIRARFPLGIYRGHRPDRQADLLPSPLRLHAALVAAAGNGCTAASGQGALSRDGDASRALEWLEDNPPDYIELPRWEMNADQTNGAFAFRDEGVVENATTAPTRRKARRFVTDSTALAGPIGWGWAQVPDDIQTTLDALCADVPCLGEADSPVVLEVGTIEPTHRRAQKQGPFNSVAIRLPVAAPGRTAELDVDYVRAQPIKPPSVSADKWKASELPAPPSLSHDLKAVLGYDEITPTIEVNAPWVHIVHFPTNRDVGPDDRVAWSVTMHRALTALLGDDASPLVTGRYTTGAPRPTNRIAIQPLPESIVSASAHPHLGAGMALLLPEGGLEPIATVLASLTRLYRGVHGGIRLGAPTIHDAASFWHAPDELSTRLWTAIPAVLPETRRQPSRGERSWTLGDSALLSVGFTYRDHLGAVAVQDRNAPAGERYSALIAAVERGGVQALSTHRIADSDTGKYVHKLPKGLVAQPYRLVLGPGALVSDTAIVAIGQSRHLGGGLLCPFDVPHDAAAAMGYRS
ncbi:type I-G CRISPR-associated protein Csb2 [Gordonia sp. NPDC003376]